MVFIADSLGQQIGLQTGDHVLKIGEEPFERFNERELLRAIALDNVESVTVRRNGFEKKIPIEEKWSDILTRYENKDKHLFTYRLPVVVGEVAKDTPAEKAGLQKERPHYYGRRQEDFLLRSVYRSSKKIDRTKKWSYISFAKRVVIP